MKTNMNLFENLLRIIVEDYDKRYEIEKLKSFFAQLNEREQKVLMYRFELNLTLEETAKKFGEHITRERIRQIEAKAIRKLKYKAHELISRQEKMLKELTYIRNGINKLLGDENTPTEFTVKYIKIEECNFAIRTYNCLKRAGIYTVDEVIEKIKDGTIINVRNLGRKSVQEIIDYLEKHGLIDVNAKTYSEVHR